MNENVHHFRIEIILSFGIGISSFRCYEFCGMNAAEARRVLGLSSDDEWPAKELSLQITRDQIAGLVRSAPTEMISDRYQDDLIEFDRALAYFRETIHLRSSSLLDGSFRESKSPVEEPRKELKARRGWWKFVLFFTVLSAGGFFARNEWQKRKELERQQKLAQWASDAADHLLKRRWQEALVLYQKIEGVEVNSDISLIGRRSIEAGMLEEQEQYLAYWAGEAVAAFEGNRWDETLAAIAKVKAVQPLHEEMNALAARVRFMQTAGIRQEWKNQAQAAIDQQQWDSALVWVEKILQAEPDYASAKEWKTVAEKGKKTQEINRLRAEEIYQKVLQSDQGRYDPRLLEMIREAKKLAPADVRVASLYDKIAGYARTIRVPQDFPGLQAALDAALEQDRILLDAGEYAGPFFLHVPVVLEVTTGAAVMTCDAEKAPVLTIGKKAQGAQIKGVEFRHTSLHQANDRYSAVLVSGATVTFESCRFLRGAGHGLAVIQGGNVQAEQCRFEENGWDGVSIQDSNSKATIRNCQMLSNIHHGIEVWNQASAILENNRCSENCLNGMFLDTTAPLNVKGNQLTANRDYGVVCKGSGEGVFEANRISDNLLGGAVMMKAADSLTCTKNRFEKNQGPSLLLGIGVEPARYTRNEYPDTFEKSVSRDLPEQ